MTQENVDAWKEGTDWDFHRRQFENPYKSTIAFCQFLKQNNLPREKDKVGDIGAGMGGIIEYFAQVFPQSSFVGIELNEECVNRGNDIFTKNGRNNCLLFQGDIFDLDKKHFNAYAGITCLASLLCFPNATDPITAIAKLNPEWIAISSLFNESLVEATVVTKDYSRPYSNFQSTDKFYNIYSIQKTADLLSKLGYSEFSFQRFEIDIDLSKPEHGGMGTYTERLADGRRLQISGPVLMSWYFILARKESSQ
jgi:hypothetical protein